MCTKCDINTTLTKQCSKCGEIKSLLNFPSEKRNKSNGHRNKCSLCDNVRHQERRIKLKSIKKEIIEFKKCSICKEIKHRDYFTKDDGKKSGLKSNCKKCACDKAKNPKDPVRKKMVRDAYRALPEVKQRTAQKRSLNNKRRIKEDPSYKLRKEVSRTIGGYLRKNHKSKDGSVMDYLPYTIEQLRTHIESLWEPWMSWDNHGLINNNKQTWQIDHIIPQSALPYDSMKHPNFLKCWALSNLQPLEAFANIRKSNKIITPIDSATSDDISFPQITESSLKSA